MKIHPLLIIPFTALAVFGVATNAHDQLWQFMCAHGLGGHALGVLFIWVPLVLLAAEWILIVGTPIWIFILIQKKRKGA
jgi:hypothetical protein